MSSRSVTEIDHTVTLQEKDAIIHKQKSFTIFRKKSTSPVSQTIKYDDIIKVTEKTGLSPIEIPVAILFILLAIVSSGIIYTIIWLILAAIAIKWAIRSIVTIELKNHNPIKIPYSGAKGVAKEFIDAINDMKK